MRRIFLVVFSILFVFLSSVSLFSQAQPTPVARFDFDQGPASLQNWRSAPGSGATVALDGAVFHSGTGSVRVSHGDWTESSVVSLPVTLKVGRGYRLSGWIRAEKAVTDPICRYPTPVAACLSMASFPFTNHSSAAGGTNDWRPVEAQFIATKASDEIRLHLGYNGPARGTVWFDDIRLEEITDIASFVPAQTVVRCGPAFRFTDRGWTFLHIEGKPYSRGYQHGYLMAEEIAAYTDKLAVQTNQQDPANGWEQSRLQADSLMLRQFEEEYLLEMKGIADGVKARKVKAKCKRADFDLLDAITLNSAIDLGQLSGALRKTVQPLSGKTFPPADEIDFIERLHKCSAMLANRSATVDQGIVFFQMFMWGGYTGVHWNVICDVVPEQGRRLVYETFPGGIHSGADFYLNDAGIMIGETTTQQTPFDSTGLAQSNRIRKAAQYATSIDEVVRILTTRNNGLYTNDWLIGDARTNEIAILLLGTKKYKLWRGLDRDFPGGTTDFLWSVNTNKDPDVRKEYVPDPDNAPFDLTYSPSNRDIAMVRFFQSQKGKIDYLSAVNLMASSPINRPHACDGKVTSSEMAREMVFMGNFGKTTLREKIPGETPRMAALPDAIPHLTLGYSTFAPKWVTAGIQVQQIVPDTKKPESKPDLGLVKDSFTFKPVDLWVNTVYAASDKENWFVSATAAYHSLLRRLPASPGDAAEYLRDSLTDLNCRVQYTIASEGNLVPLQAHQIYDRTGHYQIPRIRGLFLLHQLRLYLGNDRFSALMKDLHSRFKERPLTQAQFVAALNQTAGNRNLEPVVRQWLETDRFPEIDLQASLVAPVGSETEWTVRLKIGQEAGKTFVFRTLVEIETAKGKSWRPIEVSGPEQTLEWRTAEKPLTLLFNAANDIPVLRENYFTFGNFADTFASTWILHGTSRTSDAQHTMGLRLQRILADSFSEILPPLKKESETDAADLSDHDLILLGGAADNRLVAELAPKLGIAMGNNWFSWKGTTYGHEDDGLVLVMANPWNRERMLTLIIANSALQLFRMTENYLRVPSWAVFRAGRVVASGYHSPERFQITLR